MPSPDRTYIQSLDPGTAVPVATTIRATSDANSAAVQHVILTDVRSDVGVTVRSYAAANPVAVFPVDPTGAHLTVQTVAQGGAPWTLVGSVGASQLGAPWSVLGSVAVTQASSPWVTRGASGGEYLGTVGASVTGQVTVTASVIGVPTVVGSVLASQGGPPWTVVASVIGQPTVTASVVGVPTVVASVIGQPTVTASVIGQPTVTASVIGVPTVVGSVLASQGGAPWTVVASVIGAPTFIGSVSATIVGGGAGDGSILDGVTSAIKATVRSDGSGVHPLATTIAASGMLVGVSSQGGGNLLRVHTVVGPGGGDGSLLDGVDATVKATVRSLTGDNPLAVAIADTTGTHRYPVDVIASVTGQLTVTASLIGVPTVVGSIGASQLGAPWTVIASVIGQPTVTASISGEVRVTSGGTLPVQIVGGGAGDGAIQDGVTSTIRATVRSMAADHPLVVTLVDCVGGIHYPLDIVGTVTGSVVATQGGAPWTVVASVIGQPTVTASLVGVPTVVASVIGQPTVTASLIGVPTVIGSVLASQGGAPWTVVASVIGQPTVTASVIGQVTVTASLIGVPSVVASVGATQLGSWAVLARGTMPRSADYGVTELPVITGGYAIPADTASIAQVGSGQAVPALADLQGRLRVKVDSGEVGARQVGAPWTVIASVIGQPTVTASLIGVPTVVGSVLASQGGAPWTTIASVIGQPTVTASIIGVPTFIGSVAATIVGGGTGDGSLLDGVTNTIKATVRSDASGIHPLATTIVASGMLVGVTSQTGGNLLRVHTVVGPGGGDGALLDGADGTVKATVRSLAGDNPLAVAIADTAGVHRYPVDVIASVTGQLTVTASVVGVPTVIGSVGASQLGAPWTVVASTIGQVTVTASVVGQPTVTASVIGVPTVIGSVLATQGGPPWTVVASVIGQPTVTASVIGAPTVVASVIGQPTVTASVIGIPTVVGSVLASQGGAPWTMVASVIGIPTVTGSISATIVGGGAGDGSLLDGTNSAIKATVRSDGSGIHPLATTLTASGVLVGVSSQSGGGLLRVHTVIGPGGGDGSLLDGVDGAIKATVRSDGSGVNPLATTIVASGMPVGVSSQGGGNLLRVHTVVGPGGGDGALLDGSDATVKATVRSLAGDNPLAVAIIDTAGVHRYPVDVIASVTGQLTVTASMIGVPTFVGSVGASQLGAPWTVVASVIGQPTVTASLVGVPTVVASVIGQPTVTASISGVPTIIGSVGASQLGAPWSVIGSAGATQLGSWAVLARGTLPASADYGPGELPVVTGARAIPATTSSIAAVGSGQVVPLLADLEGRLRVKVDSGEVGARQVGAPWTVTGSVGASQLGAPWTVIASVIGQPTVTASVIGQVTATVSLIGVPTVQGSVLASQGGAPWTVVASVIGVPTVVGSVGASQLGAPWTVIASVIGIATVTGSVSATIVGGGAGDGSLLDGADATIKATVRSAAGDNPLAVTLVDCVGGIHYPVDVVGTVTGSVVATQGGAPWTVVASVIGQPTVTASLIGVPTIIGSVGASQLGAPWTVVASVIGQPTVTASLVGVPTVVGSTGATQLGSWAVLARGTMPRSADYGVGELPVITGGYAIPADTASIAQVGSGQSVPFLTDVMGRLRVKVDSGEVGARQVGAPWTVVASVIGLPAVVGSVGATQLGAPWTVIASVIGQPTVTASLIGVPTVVGSVGASQLGAPWTVVASVIGQPTVTASVIGQVTVTASVIGIPSVVASVGASQLGSWAVLARGTMVRSADYGPGELPVITGGYAIPATVSSIAQVGSGQAVPVLADLEGRLRVKVDSGELGARQVGAPWTTITSVSGIPTVIGSVGATQLGAPWTVVASVIGQPTVTASLVGIPTFIGSVLASQGGGRGRRLPASSGNRPLRRR